MAEISQREKVLLGYSPNSIQRRKSDDDVDFSDVFGGPPRRSSAQEFYSNEHDNVIVNVDDLEAQRSKSSSWFGMREKPVFGDETRVRRRYAATGDFFDDIFRGDQPSSSPSCSHSPRNMPLPSSAPGSRIMSPSRTFLPTPEPFASPAMFSLPSRMSNTEFIATTPIIQGSFSPARSRFNKSITNQDGLGSSSRSRSLSRQVSGDVKESVNSGTLLDGLPERPGTADTVKTSEGTDVDFTKFHFSIYKWPNNGVPLVMSVRKRNSEATKLASKTKRGVQSGGGVPENQANDSIHASDSLVYLIADSGKSMDDRTYGVQETTTLYGSKEAENVPNISAETSPSIRDSLLKSTSRKSNTRPLKSLFKEEKNGDKEASAVKGVAKTLAKEAEKKPVPDNAVASQKAQKTKIHEATRERKKNDHSKSDVPGTVKEYVKIFNQENPLQASNNATGRSQSKKWKSAHSSEVDDKLRTLSATTDDEMQTSYVNWEEPLPNMSEVMDESSFKSGKQQYGASGVSGVPETANPASINVPKEDFLRPASTMRETYGDDVQEMLNSSSTQSKNRPEDETMVYETKVLQWSKGKEGNIRALLSTLQYVLWPNSGWKPIPLVDIIEGNAVKRAYQRAMLCLHPDKLQQKGAPTHHKFIAEKVFDIIQEAWDQFNSLGPL